MTTQAQPVPETNKTTLGLYATPREAYAMWTADPDRVTLLDVRTAEEYVFGGHPSMARNIPLVFPFFEKLEGEEAARALAEGRKPGCGSTPNPEFLSAVMRCCKPTDTILVLCATGHRGALAVNALAQAGYTKVYNILNGFEGDRVDDPGSVYHGKHMRNGWKNAGMPWGYDFHPDLMWENAPSASAGSAGR